MVYPFNNEHPYAHLTDDQINLFIVSIQIPHSDFKFDTERWTIRSLPGIVEPDDDELEDWIEFWKCTSYFHLVFSLGARELMSWTDAKRIALRLLDIGPEAVNKALFNEIEQKVNWKRDGF